MNNFIRSYPIRSNASLRSSTGIWSYFMFVFMLLCRSWAFVAAKSLTVVVECSLDGNANWKPLPAPTALRYPYRRLNWIHRGNGYAQVNGAITSEFRVRIFDYSDASSGTWELIRGSHLADGTAHQRTSDSSPHSVNQQAPHQPRSVG